MQRPYVRPVDEPNTGFPQGIDVALPRRVASVRRIHAGKDDDWQADSPDGLAHLRKSLVVHEAARELCDHVGRRWSHDVAVNGWMRSGFAGEARFMTDG